jgi:starvation-inducible DNA-binding protein
MMTFSGAFQRTEADTESQAQPAVEETAPETVQEPAATLETLIFEMVSLASYIDKLYTQSHLIHLNIEGPLFLPLHGFLKEQYQAHVENFDTVAELVRSMDYLMPMCGRGLDNAYKKFKHVKSYDCKEMLIVYLKNLEDCGMMAKEVTETAKTVEAPDVENAMAELVNFCFKSAWMLKSTLRGS